MNIPDPFADQIDAAARQVARAHADFQRKHGNTPIPAAVDLLIDEWMSTQVTVGCEHLKTNPVQPVAGFIRQPAVIYCVPCGFIVSKIDKAFGPTCDVCGDRHPTEPVMYPLGAVGHLVGQVCHACHACHTITKENAS